MPFKDKCGICSRVLSYSYLRRCQRCGRLYCRDCMVPDVATGDPTKMLCLNCARKVVSPRSVSKYDRLKSHLKFRGSFTNVVKLSFVEIDGIIRDNLPMSAYRTEAWWNNSLNLHARAWLDAGWETEEVNLKEGYVVFRKVRKILSKSSRTQITKPFTPVRTRIPRTRQTSKTKVSRLYARIKNLERQKASMPRYPGSFKPKSKHEKRLFRASEKP